MKKKWFARVIWNDGQEGGIIEELKTANKKEAMLFQKGFESAKEHLRSVDCDYLEDYFVDVTTRTKLIER